MGMLAKKKASAIQNDDRKPRIKAYAAFVCAQPFDLPAREVMRAAKNVGYDVVSVSAVQATRTRYEHLRFVAGDPPTAFVMEFLASGASQKAKHYTAANSKIGLRGVTDGGAKSAPAVVSALRPRTQETINSIVDSVLSGTSRDTLKKAVDNGAGTPRKRTARQTLLVEAPSPAPPSPPVPVVVEAVGPEPEPAATLPAAPEPTPAVVAPEPTVEPAAPAGAAVAASSQPEPQEDPEQEDDDVSQQMRDAFEVGDIVHVTQPTVRGDSFVREGRIKDKENKFAIVALGTTTNKVPYKRLSLAPRISGSRTPRANSNGEKREPQANSNGNVVEEQLLKAVPPAFMQLKAVVVATPATPPAMREAIPLHADKPAPKPVTKAAPATVVITTPPPPPAAALSEPGALTQQQKDLLAWLEMGTAFGDIIPATESALRAEATQLTQEINRLTIERDAKLKQAETLSSHIRLITQVVSGGGK